MLMVDISGSESFGSKNQFKKDIVTIKSGSKEQKQSINEIDKYLDQII